MPFTVAVVISIEGVPGKERLKKLSVDVGDDEPITIITNAPNIREGSRTVIATVGTEVEIEGETTIVKKTPVGGVMSNGMVCDSIILGWKGGAAGIAVQIPDSYAPGAIAPTSKPRMVGDPESISPEPELSAKDLKAKEKAERKAELAAKKASRKAAKESGGAAPVASDVEDVDDC